MNPATKIAVAGATGRVVVDAATGPSPGQEAATEFFTTATHNLQQAGEAAGVSRIDVVSIIGADRFAAGYGAAKIAHERAALDGPIPARIVRASQSHEFVGPLLDWGRDGDVSYVPEMRTQAVAARTVAEALADLATAAEAQPDGAIPEIAGPREARLIEMARLLVARRGGPRVEEAGKSDDPDGEVFANGGLLPGPNAVLAGPTFEEWLASSSE
jgi:hypothetical protein